jgi:hypothetical protein
MMRIALRHRARFVSEKPLHFVQVHTALNQPRGEGVPHVMEAEVRNSGSIASLPKLPNQISHPELIA